MNTIQTDPIQPFWVLNSSKYYKKRSNIPAIAHFYKFQGAPGISETSAVPDGAIDIIIECESDRLHARICGSVDRSHLTGFEEEKTYFGIRLHPEALEYIGQAPVADLTGHEYALEDLVSDKSFLRQLSEETDFERQTFLFEKAFLHVHGEDLPENSAHRLTMAIISEIYQHNGMIRMNELEAKLHYSRRHLTRYFVSTMGMDIKSFSKFVRFQYILRGIRDGKFKNVSDAAMAGNYYDQSHFQKDFRNFTNTTPKRMMKLFEETDYKGRIIVWSDH